MQPDDRKSLTSKMWAVNREPQKITLEPGDATHYEFVMIVLGSKVVFTHNDKAYVFYIGQESKALTDKYPELNEVTAMVMCDLAKLYVYDYSFEHTKQYENSFFKQYYSNEHTNRTSEATPTS